MNKNVQSANHPWTRYHIRLQDNIRNVPSWVNGLRLKLSSARDQLR
jgi:hypothetical protein